MNIKHFILTVKYRKEIRNIIDKNEINENYILLINLIHYVDHSHT